MLSEVIVPECVLSTRKVRTITTYLSAITTSFFSSKLTTFLIKVGADFLAFTSSLCVCPKPKICAKATATDVFPSRRVSSTAH
jgi:hypothetical protein